MSGRADLDALFRDAFGALIGSMQAQRLTATEDGPSEFRGDYETLRIPLIAPYRERCTDYAAQMLARFKLANGSLATFKTRPPPVAMGINHRTDLLLNGVWATVMILNDPNTLKDRAELIIHYGRYNPDLETFSKGRG